MYILSTFFLLYSKHHNYVNARRSATMPVVVKIGDKLKEARTNALLTQHQLAEKSGVTQAAIARIETDKAEPRFGTIRKLANALEIEPKNLLP